MGWTDREEHRAVEISNPQHTTDVSANRMIHWKVKVSNVNICLPDSAAVMSSCCRGCWLGLGGAVRDGLKARMTPLTSRQLSVHDAF